MRSITKAVGPSWVLAMCVSLLFPGCSDSSSADEPDPTRRVHLMNPWEGEVGGFPSIHGKSIPNGSGSWGATLMTREESCGWFVFETEDASFGPYRFIRSTDYTTQFGLTGLGSEDNFNTDLLWQDSTDVYIYADPATGIPHVQTWKPSLAGCEGGDTIAKPGAGNALHPFPQEATYASGILPTYRPWRDVQGLYERWRAALLETSGSLARVRFDDASLTVSEGIGYGMLISVYMDNADNNTRADFDGLWNYYQSFSSPTYGLMDWQVSGFSSTVQTGAATDADLDVALALLMAWKQWNDPAYLTAAQGLIDHIQEFELNAANGLLAPGNLWSFPYNPSYVSWVALRAFAGVDPTLPEQWTSSIAANYAWMTKAQHAATGLAPNWADADGSPADPGTGYANPTIFGFDAVRVPWRAAWDYVWSGDAQSQAIAARIAAWSESAMAGTTANVRDAYLLDGTPLHTDYTGGPAFTGAFASACMTDAARQAWLDKLYGQLLAQTGTEYTSYYNSTLQLLYALLLSGNMPDFMAL